MPSPPTSQTFHVNHRTHSHVFYFAPAFCIHLIYTLRTISTLPADTSRGWQLQCMRSCRASTYDKAKPIKTMLYIPDIYEIISEVLQPEGLMVIMEKVDVSQVKMTPTKPSNFQTPKGLRVRHPLFGYGNVLLASCRT